MDVKRVLRRDAGGVKVCDGRRGWPDKFKAHIFFSGLALTMSLSVRDLRCAYKAGGTISHVHSDIARTFRARPRSRLHACLSLSKPAPNLAVSPHSMLNHTKCDTKAYVNTIRNSSRHCVNVKGVALPCYRFTQAHARSPLLSPCASHASKCVVIVSTAHASLLILTVTPPQYPISHYNVFATFTLSLIRSPD